METYIKSYKNNKFRISESTWNKKLELTDESYSVSDIQHYFDYIIRKHETMTDNKNIRKQDGKQNHI